MLTINLVKTFHWPQTMFFFYLNKKNLFPKQIQSKIMVYFWTLIYRVIEFKHYENIDPKQNQVFVILYNYEFNFKDKFILY
jgi:hypothetical protein